MFEGEIMRWLDTLRFVKVVSEVVFKNTVCNDPMMLFVDDTYRERLCGYKEAIGCLPAFKDKLLELERELIEHLMVLYKPEHKSAVLNNLTALTQTLEDFLEEYKWVKEDDWNTLSEGLYEIHEQSVRLMDSLGRLGSSLKKKGLEQRFVYERYKKELKSLSRDIWSKCGKLRKVDWFVLAELDTISGRDMFPWIT